MTADVVPVVIGFVQGLLGSTVFVLALFIGFCLLLGYMKLKKTSGRAPVVKSLDERLDGRPVEYLPPTAPRGPADQLRSPELLEGRA